MLNRPILVLCCTAALAAQSRDYEPTLEPTIYYRRAASGRLVEEVILRIRHRRRLPEEIGVRLGAASLKVRPERAADTGVWEYRLDVPEPEASAATIAIGGAIYERPFQPRRKWTLHVAPLLTPGPNPEEDNQTIDAWLDRLGSDPDARLLLGSAAMLERYREAREPLLEVRLREAFKSGRFAVQAFYPDPPAHMDDFELLARSLSYAAALRKELEARIDTGILASSAAAASVLSQAGIRYLLLPGEKPATWIEGQDGRRVLAAGSLPRSLDRDALDRALAPFEGSDPDVALLTGLPARGPLAPEWRTQYAWPQWATSLPAEYFLDVEKRFAARLPVEKPPAGRRDDQVQQALAAEQIATVAWLEKAWAYPQRELDAMWRALMSGQPAPQAASLIPRALVALGSRAKHDGGVFISYDAATPAFSVGPEPRPGQAGVRLHRPGTAQLPASGRFLVMSADNVEVATIKKADAGDHLLLRLRETAGRATEVTLRFPLWEVVSAWTVDLLEQTTERLRFEPDGGLKARLTEFGVVTLALNIKR